MSKEQDSKLDYLGDAYSIIIAHAQERRGHCIQYETQAAASLNILAKVFCTNGAEYSSVILPHGPQDLPIYVSHPHGYEEFNRQDKKIFLTKEEIDTISQKLQMVLYDVNNEKNKQSLLRSLVRAQNPFLEQLIYQHKELLVRRLTQDMKAESQRIENNDEYKKICKAYEQRINNITTKDYQEVATDYCTTIFPKFLSDQDLRDISQYKDRKFLKVQDSSSEGRSYKGVHVEAQGVDFAYYQHKEVNEFSIGLAKKDARLEVGCCAGCALEFKILSLRERDKIIVHRSADFPSNMPPSVAYKSSPLMTGEERQLFDKIELYNGIAITNERQNIRMQEILGGTITTIQQLQNKIEEFAQQTQISESTRQKLLQELEASNKGNAELQEQIQKVTQEKTQLVTKLKISEQNLEAKTSELEASNKGNAELQEQIQKVTQEKTQLVTKLKTSEQNLEAKDEELKGNKEQIIQLDKQLSASEEGKTQFATKLEAIHEQLKAKDEELKRSKEIITQTEEANQQLKQELRVKTSELQESQKYSNESRSETNTNIAAQNLNHNPMIEEPNLVKRAVLSPKPYDESQQLKKPKFLEVPTSRAVQQAINIGQDLLSVPPSASSPKQTSPTPPKPNQSPERH